MWLEGGKSLLRDCGGLRGCVPEYGEKSSGAVKVSIRELLQRDNVYASEIHTEVTLMDHR